LIMASANSSFLEARNPVWWPSSSSTMSIIGPADLWAAESTGGVIFPRCAYQRYDLSTNLPTWWHQKTCVSNHSCSGVWFMTSKIYIYS
jgi:hypothetical protein